MFDSITTGTDGEQNVPGTIRPTFGHGSDVPMEICPEEDISDKRRNVTKPRSECVAGKTTKDRRRKGTVIQKREPRNNRPFSNSKMKRDWVGTPVNVADKNGDFICYKENNRYF